MTIPSETGAEPIPVKDLRSLAPTAELPDPVRAARFARDEAHFEAMSRSTGIGDLTAALCSARATFESIGKDTKGQEGNRFYMYATLQGVIAATQPALDKAGLDVFHCLNYPNDEQIEIVATLVHGKSGQWRSSSCRLPAGDDTRSRGAKAVGSAITYGRRYTYLMLLGLAPAEDDDGDSAPQGRRRPSARWGGEKVTYDSEPAGLPVVEGERAATRRENSSPADPRAVDLRPDACDDRSGKLKHLIREGKIDKAVVTINGFIAKLPAKPKCSKSQRREVYKHAAALPEHGGMGWDIIGDLKPRWEKLFSYQPADTPQGALHLIDTFFTCVGPGEFV